LREKVKVDEEELPKGAEGKREARLSMEL